MKYPVTRKDHTIDTYFGKEVADPYRWLEDDNSQETAEWVKAQNEVTFGHLQSIPFRDRLKDDLTSIWNYPKVSCPVRSGGRHLIHRNSGLQNQWVVFLLNPETREEKLLLDPNTFSEDGTVSLMDIKVSKDGRYAASMISTAGSDWMEIRVHDIAGEKDLDEVIHWIKFSSVAWFGNGFFYARYEEPKGGDELKGLTQNCGVYYHQLYTDPGEDQLVFQDLDHPEWSFSPDVTEDQKHLIIYTSESTHGEKLFFKDLSSKSNAVLPLAGDFSSDLIVLDHKDELFTIQTNHDAPNGRIVQFTVETGLNPAVWKDLVTEKEELLDASTAVGGRIITRYLKDAYSKVDVYTDDGQFIKTLDLPGIGTAVGFRGSRQDSSTWFSFTSFTEPGQVYHYDFATEKIAPYFDSSTLPFNPDLYETKQEFYTSKDGTKVPIFIIAKKGLEKNGKNPAILYGYGGFSIPMSPLFSPSILLWLDQGGVYAVANLRGGNEYGEKWHEAGTKLQKQNVFDDCIAAAEHLIQQKYTSADCLGLKGGSNGGLLVGAVINQRPDLFAVGLPAVGVMDMLRYHKFTIGHFWAADYGTSEDSKEMFEYLLGYSPLHTIHNKDEYPAIMVLTADHDDRVVPAHSFKYAATLQEKAKSSKPLVIRIETDAGHGAGVPTSKVIQTAADEQSFALFHMNVERD